MQQQKDVIGLYDVHLATIGRLLVVYGVTFPLLS